MPITFNELPDWEFEVHEVSAGVYKVYGKDKYGRTVEATGTNPDVLLQKSKDSAIRLIGPQKG